MFVKFVWLMNAISKIKRLARATKAFRETYHFGGYKEIIRNSLPANRLQNKKILVTGGTSGIGLAIAEKFVNEGARVLVTGRNINKLEICKQNNPNLEVLNWDLNDYSTYEEKINECNNLLGGIDILINNAGIQPSEFFPNVSEEEWDRIYAINSKALFLLSQAMCKRWIHENIKTGYKKIINISSQGGFIGATYPYRMSKWDIRGLTQGLGKTMVKHRVLVNGIAPGVIRTAMQEFAIEQKDNCYCNQNKVERFALPEEIAELATYLASDSCTFIVGQTILCDGGASII